MLREYEKLWAHYFGCRAFLSAVSKESEMKREKIYKVEKCNGRVWEAERPGNILNDLF